MTISPEDRAFFGNAVLETILPEASNVTLPEALDDGGDGGDVRTGDDEFHLPTQQRNYLYFDERVTVFVVLRIAGGSVIALKEYLARLTVRLNVHVVDAQQLHQSEPSKYDGTEKELVFTGGVKSGRNPYIAVDRSGEYTEAENPPILGIWEIEAVLNRPRSRLAKRAVAFSASATLIAAKAADAGFSDDNEPSALEAAPANILDALATIPALRNQISYVPSSSIWRIQPGPEGDPDTMHIGQQTLKKLPISPAVSARLRCSRLPTNTARPAMIASLDFEVTPSASFDVLLNKAIVTLGSDGHIELLSPLKMPIKCRPRDIVTVLYRILPPTGPPKNRIHGSSSQSHTVGLLDMLLESTLIISPRCQPTITMSWRSTTDLFVGQPPQRLSRSIRPNSLVFPTTGTTKTTAEAETRASASGPNTSPTSTLGGLTISFAVPAIVPLGRAFNMKVVLTNNSLRPLKLVLIPLARRPPPTTSLGLVLPSTSFHRHMATSSTISTSSTNPSNNNNSDVSQRSSTNPIPNSTKTAPAVLEEPPTTIMTSQKHPSTAEPDLIPLTTDLRLGPLPVGSCHESQIKMMAMKAGVCRLDAVRVVDLDREREAGVGSGVGVVRADLLPEIVVVATRVGGGGQDVKDDDSEGDGGGADGADGVTSSEASDDDSGDDDTDD